MKVVILAGGLGTRLAEETEVRPKPMVEIGERPILWHIMKHYAFYGLKEFIIALGYKGEAIKHFFLEQTSLRGNLTIDMRTSQVTVEKETHEDWIVHLVDTGPDSQTGGRIARVRDYLDNDTFMLTYGDGVSNVDLSALLDFHNRAHRIVTLTAVRPPARFGGLVIDGEGWINGGFMAMQPEILDYITSDKTILETDVLDKLAAERQLAAYRHDDFWQCMDTLRDKRQLENLWQEGKARWKTWA